jgi:hypothetical protein
MGKVTRELHVEHLIGRRVHDADGKSVGRIHELCIETVDGESVVTELHFGPAAILERIAGFVIQLPFLSLLPRGPRLRRARWEDVDFSDPRHPKLRVSRESLDAPDYRSLR